MGPFLRQLWCVSGVLLNMVGQGMALSFSSTLMPALRAADADIKADLETASWISSSIGLGSLPGFFASSYFMDCFGRKITHGLIVIPGAIGWLVIYFATNTTTLLIGRVMCGFTAGASVCLGAVVIGEYTTPVNRGMFLNLKTVAVCVGSTAIHIVGNFYSWRTIALLSLIPHIIALVIISTWPESPAWLAFTGRFDKSEEAFFWLRGKDEHSAKELDEMIRAQKDQASKRDDMSLADKLKDFLRKFTKKDFLKPVFIIFIGVLLLEVSGRHIFPAYALDIISEITGSKKETFYFTLALDLIITASAMFSSALVKIMKRRTLLLVSGAASVVVVLTVCTYLFLVSRKIIENDYPWIPIGLFVIFFILVNFGCTPIPLAFLGELLPLAHRGAGSAVSGLAMALILNLTLQVTPFLLVNIKVYGTFAVLGGCMAVLLLILYFVLPETKDKTLQEIEDFFNNGKFKEDVVKSDDEEVKVKMIAETKMTLT